MCSPDLCQSLTNVVLLYMFIMDVLEVGELEHVSMSVYVAVCVCVFVCLRGGRCVLFA